MKGDRIFWWGVLAVYVTAFILEAVKPHRSWLLLLIMGVGVGVCAGMLLRRARSRED